MSDLLDSKPEFVAAELEGGMPSLRAELSRLFGSSRLRLILLLQVALLPIAGLAVYRAMEDRARAATEVQRHQRRLVRLTIMRQERTFQDARRLLSALSEVEPVRSAGPGCAALLASLVAQSPGIRNLGIVRLDGRVACSGAPVGETLPVNDVATFRSVLSREGPVFTEFRAPDGREILIGIVIPISAQGHEAVETHEADRFVDVHHVHAGAFAIIDLTRLYDIERQADVAPGSVWLVLDRFGRMLARVPDAATDGVRPDADVIQRALGGKSEGLTRAKGGDGRERLYAFGLLEGPWLPAYVAVGTPLDAVYAHADRALYQHLGAVAAAGLLLAVIAAFAGKSDAAAKG